MRTRVVDDYGRFYDWVPDSMMARVRWNGDDPRRRGKKPRVPLRDRIYTRMRGFFQR